MMKIDQEALTNIKSKINELQSLFKYGERVLPFLEDLLSFISEITPILTEVENSLEESTNKHVKASHKLEDVTSQTEMATQEILDKVDQIIMKVMNISEYFLKISKNSEQKLNLLKRAQKEFINVLDGNINETRIKKFIKSVDRHQLNRANRLGNRIKEHIEEIESLAMSIMMALQVQDITSQQLASVNHLIASIQGKIITLLKNFSNVGDDQKIILDNKAYDEDATYEDKHSQQDIADKIISDVHSASQIPSSQEEIDRLLDSGLKN